MKNKQISSDVFEIEVTVQQVFYGDTEIAKITGWNNVERTYIKLKCTDCTVMIFGINDMNLFKGISVGDKFFAVAKEWKTNIFHFKKFTKKGIIEQKI